MPSLKDLRKRITTVKNTQKVTRAMQLVATARLRKVQLAAENSRPYAKRLERVISDLGWRVSDMPEVSKLLVGTGAEQKYLCIVVTSERGLCGALNASIIHHVKMHIEHFLADGKDVKLLCVGYRGYRILQTDYGDRIIDMISLRDVRQVQYAHAYKIGQKVLQMFKDNEFDVCCVFYAKYRNIFEQHPRNTQLIPAVYTKAMTLQEMEDANQRSCCIDCEPNEQELMNDLLPRNVSAQIYRALLENAASEQGARMTAMDSATRNAGKLIEKLTLEYNRTRQMQITNELMEIISGSEALKARNQ